MCSAYPDDISPMRLFVGPANGLGDLYYFSAMGDWRSLWHALNDNYDEIVPKRVNANRYLGVVICYIEDFNINIPAQRPEDCLTSEAPKAILAESQQHFICINRHMACILRERIEKKMGSSLTPEKIITAFAIPSEHLEAVREACGMVLGICSHLIDDSQVAIILTDKPA